MFRSQFILSFLLIATIAAGQAKGAEHPHIKKAHHHLEQAKGALENAEHDFGGHRAKALAFVNQALEETKLANEYFATHQEEFKKKPAGK